MPNNDNEALISLLRKMDSDPTITCPRKVSEPCDGCEFNTNDDKCDTYARKAAYLIENGVIVPPCKVGDTVYVLTSDSPTGIEETRVSQIKIKIKENGKVQYRISAPCIYDDWGEAHWTFCIFDFGKTVFLTKEEAEQKLKEMRGDTE